MGKQNSTDNKLWNGIVIIMGVIFLVLALATLLAPIVVLILFLINLIRYLVQDRKGKATNFWLSKSEQEEYKKTVYILARAEDEKRKIQDSVNAHGISRNQDGQISQRSYAGKGLRERENNAKSLINEYTPIYKELQFRPYKRWRKARNHYSKAFGYGFIIFTMVAIFGFLQLINIFESKPLISTIQSEAVDSTKIIGQPQVVEEGIQTKQVNNKSDSSIKINGLEFYGISIGIMAGFIAALIVIWFIGWLIGRIRFGLKNPEPPLVSMNNVDTYIKEYMEKIARKEAERQQRKERNEQKREQKIIVKKSKKDEEICIVKQKSKEINQKTIDKTILNMPVTESEIDIDGPKRENIRKRSKEEEMFITWANSLRNEGFNITGNWEDWDNSGLWKNLSVVSSIDNINIRIVIEYYVESKQIYFGIAKLNNEEKVSQKLLNSEAFKNIITENGLTIKNNEWWYCLKFSTLDKVFHEYIHLIKAIN